MAPSSPSCLVAPARLEGPLTPTRDPCQEEHKPQLQPRHPVSIKGKVRRVEDRSSTGSGPSWPVSLETVCSIVACSPTDPSLHLDTPRLARAQRQWSGLEGWRIGLLPRRATWSADRPVRVAAYRQVTGAVSLRRSPRPTWIQARYGWNGSEYAVRSCSTPRTRLLRTPCTCRSASPVCMPSRTLCTARA